VRREQIAALNERAVAQIALRKKRKQAEGRAFFCGSAAPSASLFAPFSRLFRN